MSNFILGFVIGVLITVLFVVVRNTSSYINSRLIQDRKERQEWEDYYK